MEWVGDFKEIIQVMGPYLSIVLIILMIAVLALVAVIYMIKAFSSVLKSLSISVDRLADKVSSPYLDVSLSLKLFRSVMADHVSKKLNILGDILRENSIHQRRPQIEKNIERDFKKITSEEAEILSEYKSVCGDMGKILTESVDWPDFLKKVYAIFFTDHEERLKIKDIKSLMNSIVNEIAQKIEDNGVHN